MTGEEIAELSRAVDRGEYIELISIKELMETVLHVLETDELDKFINAYDKADNADFKAGFMSGMAIASMLTTKCQKYLTKASTEEDANNNKEKTE